MRLPSLTRLAFIPRFETEDWFVRIVTVVVDPGARGRGIARALLADVERVGREEGVAFLEVTAGHHRPEARKLFESARRASRCR